jgi:hypothetical protein
LDALEADKVPDTLMRQTLDAVQGVLVVLHKHGADLPGQQAVADATATPTLDVKHKLKLTLPIIPGLLRYELELGSETKLRTRWRRLKWRAYGRDSRLLLTLSVFTALALGGASYLVTDVCQLDLPQRLIITGTFCLAPAIVLLVGFYRGRIPTTTVFSSVRKGGTITGILFGTLFLVWGIGWTIWATVKPPVQVSPCLELDLVTGTGQRICPSASGELVPPPGSLDGLQNLSGRAILTHAGGCACEWEGKTREGHPLEKLHGLTRDCSFSFGLPDRPTSAYYLMLSVGEQHKLFIISVQGR